MMRQDVINQLFHEIYANQRGGREWGEKWAACRAWSRPPYPGSLLRMPTSKPRKSSYVAFAGEAALFARLFAR